MAAPSTVQRSSASPNRNQPNTATTMICRKLIGVSIEASPSFSARVQHMCAVVPRKPASTIHSQVMPTGVSQ